MPAGEDVGKMLINCPQCGARYRWRPELAGKRIRCKQCGDAFQPDGQEQTQAHAALVAAAGARSGFVIPDRRGIREMSAEQDEMTALHNWILPGIVVGLALVWRGWQVADHAGRLETVALWQSAGVVVFEWLLVSMALAGAVVVSAMMLGLELGRYGPAVLKAVAVALFMAAFASFCSSFDRQSGDLYGMTLGVPSILILGWVMFSAMFKADLQEALLATVVSTTFVTGVLMAVAVIFRGDVGIVLGFGRPV